MSPRAQARYDQQLAAVQRRAHRIFAWFLLGQWPLAVGIALVRMPDIWLPVLAVGGLLTVFPLLMLRVGPGHPATRHVVAACQILWSAVLGHVTGRVEGMFHVFGSMAFLAFYRDATVLITATIVVVAEQVVGSPLATSLYSTTWWRLAEHTAWLAFENVVLALGIHGLHIEMRTEADRFAELEGLAERVEESVAVRTAALKASEDRFRTLATGAPIGIVEVDNHGLIAYANPRFCAMVKRTRKELAGRPWHQLAHPDDSVAAAQCWADREDEPAVELRFQSANTSRWVALKASALGDLRYVITFEDVNERHAAERKLAEVNQKLVATARTAGMAEVAAGVLHNVGNVLNSVNASAIVMAEHLRDARINNLRKAVALITEHGADLAAFLATDKGRALPRYLAVLAEHLDSTKTQLDAELTSLLRNIEHIKAVVTTQQGYARRVAHVETFALAEIVDDAFRVVAGNAEAHRIELVRGLPSEELPIETDRHRLLQILLNLIGNSIHAIRDRGGGGGKITVRTQIGADEVRLAVEDDGIGLSADAKKKLFQHGFTTKRDGHGFGLHSAANAASELGGSLVGDSPGERQGATFTLAFPRVMPRALARRAA